jgi:RNA polymerase sigma factor for flagellar operon FliA
MSTDRDSHEPAAAPLEPRYHARAPVAVDVVVRRTTGSELRGTSRNLSEGGVLVTLSEALAVGERVSVALPEADDLAATSLVLAAKAVRSRASERGHDVALTFTDADPALTARVHAVVASAIAMAWLGHDEPPPAHELPNEVAARFIPIIRRVARTLGQRLPPHVSLDDLVGAGFVALVELYPRHAHFAVDDLERMFVPRLRWAMLDSLRQNDPLKRRGRAFTRQIDEQTRELQRTLGRAPTREELASHLGVPLSELEDALATARRADVRSSDEALEHELADHDAPAPDELTATRESHEQLQLALEALPPRHRKILELYYGEELKLRQIGNLLGVTEARISQLLHDALGRLRRHGALSS